MCETWLSKVKHSDSEVKSATQSVSFEQDKEEKEIEVSNFDCLPSTDVCERRLKCGRNKRSKLLLVESVTFNSGTLQELWVPVFSHEKFQFY